MKILVIEDSRFIRLAIERMLVKAGCNVTAVGDGQGGLQIAQEGRPDVILLDMMLPTLEGTSVLRQLKQDPITKTIPVIVLSALSQKNEGKLKRAGAAGYLEKSKLNLNGDGRDLMEAISDLLGAVSLSTEKPLQMAATTDRK